MNDYKTIPAIKIVQPLGVFYAFKIKANELNEIAYSSRAKYKKSLISNAFKVITGSQRDLDDDRGKEISRFINSVESALPNSIILGANFEENGSMADDDDRWYATELDNGFCQLHIPRQVKLAAIIDGQHRLSGCMKSERNDMELLCAVYLDLPTPYHAFLFASINSNQKKVPRSLAYELYGFGTENEDRNIWSPEKFAVDLVRKLNFSTSSKLKGKVILGAQDDEENRGFISLASLVNSIMKLITTNPKTDRDNILHYRNEKGRKTLVSNSKLPLRNLYIQGRDKEIEKIVTEFVNLILERRKDDNSSFLFKTIGIESLFDLLKIYIGKNERFDINEFSRFISPIWSIDFEDDFYTASGIGKSRISNTIQIVLGYKDYKDIKNEEDAEKIKSLIS